MDIKEIQEERQGDYGDAKESHQSIGDSWSVYLSRRFNTKISLGAKDVAILMVLFKAMREAYKHKQDNLLDMASYADFAKKFCEEPSEGMIEVETLKQSCSECLYALKGAREFPCAVCFEERAFSRFTPNNVPSEVPFDREPTDD